MTYLLTISIGPVQEFIAAARKTADLYAGSSLLVAVVKAAVGALEQRGAEFIFPASPDSNGANKILVRVQGNPAEAAASAKAAAQGFLWAEFQKATESVKDFIDMARAKAQIEHFLEFYAAWLEETGDYAQDRKNVEKLLSGRKALRDFQSVNQKDNGVPKSPLDPAFACVFEGGKVTQSLIDQNRFKTSEVLDAVSLLKREWGRKKIRVLARTNELAQRAIQPSFTSDDDEYTPAYPYYAIMVADGDSMGAKLEALEKEGGAEAHKKFSEALDCFAEEARKTVSKYDGFPIYTGGDDVLALLPVTQALACANALQEEFRKQASGCTLSAGIAIVHYREPLSTSLGQARAAEKAAKSVDGKNAVCVALHTRGGSPLSVAQHWQEAADLVGWLQQSVNGELPRGLPYELRELAREWPEDFASEVLHDEAQRIADRKVKQDGLKAEVKIPARVTTPNELRQLAHNMILARFLSGKGDRA